MAGELRVLDHAEAELAAKLRSSGPPTLKRAVKRGRGVGYGEWWLAFPGPAQLQQLVDDQSQPIDFGDRCVELLSLLIVT